MDLKLILMTPKVLLVKESTEGFEDGKWEDPALKEAEQVRKGGRQNENSGRCQDDGE